MMEIVCFCWENGDKQGLWESKKKSYQKNCDFLPQFEHACLSSEEPQVRKKKAAFE
jgi:hypothetical protein